MADRAVSNVVGFVLVFSVIVTSVAVVTVVGMGSLTDVRNAEQADNAQRAFEVLAENMADIHQRDAPSRATEVDLKDVRLYVADPITITVTVRDTDTSPVTTEQVQERSDPLVFDTTSRTAMYYEAGALYRIRGNAGTVIRDAPFVLGENHVAIPVLNFTASDTTSVSGTTTLVRASENAELLDVTNTTGKYDEVNVTVESPRHEQWETHLSEHSVVSGCGPPPGNAEAVSCTVDGAEFVYVTHVRIGVDIEQ
jgi:hypothetical protein